MKKKFAFTIGAIKEVCERCPDHDINRLLELFSKEDAIEQLDNTIWFICTLNKWAVFRDTGEFEGALTEEDCLKMEMSDIRELFADAMVSYNSDRTSETEAEPKKKEEDATIGKK